MTLVLTPEQEARIPEFRDKWLQYLTTELNEELVEQVIETMYGLLGLPPPEIIFCDSPLDSLRILERDYAKCPKAELYNKEEGEYWLCYAALFDFCKSCGVEFDETKLDLFSKFAKEVGWVFPYKEPSICFCARKPTHIKWNTTDQLHAIGEPAIKFRDDLELWAINGVRLDNERYHKHPDIWDARWLLNESNAEIRRIILEQVGAERIFSEIDSVKLHEWREYALHEIREPIDTEKYKLLSMACPSTGHHHCIRVPPHITNAREAATWVNNGIDPEHFLVEA
jgi:hypothetical protein